MSGELAAGSVFRLPEPVVVTRQRLDALAAALGQPIPAVQAPPTYLFVLAEPAFEALFTDPRLGLDLSRIIHVDQSFEYVRPVVVGDVLDVSLTIGKVRVRGEAEFITVLGEVVDTVAGAIVATFSTTLLHRNPVGGAASAAGHLEGSTREVTP
jgi:acyl-CoA thioesterase FadM